jgi:hypothetical protein
VYSVVDANACGCGGGAYDVNMGGNSGNWKAGGGIGKHVWYCGIISVLVSIAGGDI